MNRNTGAGRTPENTTINGGNCEIENFRRFRKTVVQYGNFDIVIMLPVDKINPMVYDRDEVYVFLSYTARCANN